MIGQTRAAAILALTLVELGQVEPARTLGQDTLERGRRVLGPDHPTTLLSAAVLTLALAWLGELEPARTLGQETLERCRRVLGPDHRSPYAWHRSGDRLRHFTSLSR